MNRSQDLEVRVYLDVCALCRPFDDQRQMRIRIETGAVDLILAHVRARSLILVVSPAHDAEIAAIEDLEERSHLTLLLQAVGTRIAFNLPAARRRATELVARRIGVADAAHLSFAEQAHAAFITVDNRLIRQCHRVSPSVWCGNPVTYSDQENLA